MRAGSATYRQNMGHLRTLQEAEVPSIVHEYVDATELLEHRGRHALDAFVIGHVQSERLCDPSGRGDLGLDVLDFRCGPGNSLRFHWRWESGR